MKSFVNNKKRRSLFIIDHVNNLVLLDLNIYPNYEENLIVVVFIKMDSSLKLLK